MMNKDGVLNLARSLLEINPDNLNGSDYCIKHLGNVYDLSKEIVNNIRTQYPNIPILEEEVSLASGLHDIGRILNKNQLFHELRGANYVEEKGLEKGIATSLKDIYRIAQMFRSHGFVYEHWKDFECFEDRKEFEPLEESFLLPRTWQECIVTYSDLSSLNGERVKVEDRINEVLYRYENNPEYKNSTVINAVRSGIERILELSKRVEDLEQGKLNEQEIRKYGFL